MISFRCRASAFGFLISSHVVFLSASAYAQTAAAEPAPNSTAPAAAEAAGPPPNAVSPTDAAPPPPTFPAPAPAEAPVAPSADEPSMEPAPDAQEPKSHVQLCGVG